MKRLAVHNLVEATGATLVRGDAEATFAGVCTDSRQPVEGSLFAALCGEVFDGHRFADAALGAGCAGAMVQRERVDEVHCPDGFVVAVDDTTAALGRLAAWWRDRFDATVVGVTGSNGKSTTKEMLGHVLRRLGRKVVVPQKSFNNHVGVPLTLFAVDEDTEVVVVEIGTNAPGEIATLADIVRPDVALVTNIGPCHLEKLGSLEGVAREKTHLFDRTVEGGTVVVNLDDPYLRGQVDRPGPVVSFGRAEGADVRIVKEQPLAGRTRITLNGSVEFVLPVHGEHNVANAAGALAVCRALGVDVAEAARAIEDFAGLSMRLETIRCGDGVTVIDDAYNANPQSVAVALKQLAAFQGMRRVAVLGDMLELGQHAQDYHREVGTRAARCGVDVLATVGLLGQAIAEGATGAGMPPEAVHVFDTPEAALAGVTAVVQPGDTVLVKASRGMKLERIVNLLVERFMERE